MGRKGGQSTKRMCEGCRSEAKSRLWWTQPAAHSLCEINANYSPVGATWLVCGLQNLTSTARRIATGTLAANVVARDVVGVGVLRRYDNSGGAGESSCALSTAAATTCVKRRRQKAKQSNKQTK